MPPLILSTARTLILVTALTLTPGLCSAGQVQKEIDLTRAIVQNQRRGIVASSMPLTLAEQQKFWPLYGEYQKAMAEVNDRLVKVIKEYSKHQHKLSDKRAAKLLDEYFAIEKATLEVRMRYRQTFAGVLPAKKVARFFQLENKMDAMLDMELARGVPLVK